MIRVVLDSNAVDPFVKQPGAYEAARASIDAGELEMLFTHVNIDELAAVPDVNLRATLLLIMVDLGRLIPTGAFAVGISRANFARVVADADVEIVETLRSGNIGHTRDALIAFTAVFEKCALVTNEKRLSNRARDLGVEVITSTELLTRLGFDAKDAG